MKTEIQKRIGALALLALLTLCLRPSTTFAQAWGNFVLSSSPIVGNQPNSVVTVDVNGDGKVDLICANGLDNTLSVLTNDGSGDFTLASTLNVGGFPYGVAAADVNGDGKMDLICGNPNANALTVLTNDGSGGFAIASTPAAGIQAEYPIAADVNGDGKVDLVCANASSISSANTITVLTNDGSGNFTLASALTVGSNPRWVTAADINGDGKVDLITANFFSYTLTVLTNDGHGGFAISSSPYVGYQPVWVTAADVNGDGKPDLICANDYDGAPSTLTILTNDGSGGFVLASKPAVGKQADGLVAADITGNGQVDLVCANAADNTLMVLTNGSSGNFSIASTLNVGTHPYSVTAVDVNGDGHVDLISANSGTNTLSVLINTPFMLSSPPLNIGEAGNQAVLFWPASATNAILQTATNLASPNWVNVSNGVPVIAVTVTNQSPPLFFRLQPN